MPIAGSRMKTVLKKKRFEKKNSHLSSAITLVSVGASLKTSGERFSLFVLDAQVQIPVHTGQNSQFSFLVTFFTAKSNTSCNDTTKEHGGENQVGFGTGSKRFPQNIRQTEPLLVCPLQQLDGRACQGS
jgi:hypothetical protein